MPDEWPAFAASWDDLGPDTYMADGGRYRYRRHATYSVGAPDDIRLAPHRPHFQARDYNALNGGIDRWFEPVVPAIANGSVLRAILALAARVFTRAEPAPRWDVEVHQFRIVAEAGHEGRPTPEGVHRDGVDFVLVLLVRRENIASGRTDLYDGERRPVASFTLTEPLSAVFLDDRRLAHGVTPVTPLDASRPSYRDVLVVTFRRLAA